MKPKSFYHGTRADNLPSIMKEGLKPFVNFDSDAPVVSLCGDAEKALIEAYVVDSTKLEQHLSKFKELANEYAALLVDHTHYKVKSWQVDEWWIGETISPEHISVVLKKPLDEVRAEFKRKVEAEY